MTTEVLIDGILQREGGYQEDKADRGNANGGATNFGITSVAWGEFKRLGRPATRAEVRAITKDEARAFYLMRYVAHSPFAGVKYEPLRVALIDFGINSGDERAIRWLQRALNLPVTGKMDERTTHAVSIYPGFLVNRALAAARLYMIDSFTDSHLEQKPVEEGLESRALSLAEFHL